MGSGGSKTKEVVQVKQYQAPNHTPNTSYAQNNSNVT